MKTVIVFATLAAAAFAVTASAQGLPKSGTIRWHTAYMVVGEAQTVAEGHVQGHGDAMGVTYNDSGSGPLHQGPVSCFYTFFMINGRGDNQGYCSFGDADGDRIFTAFTGKVGAPEGDMGTNVIVGGTGKYEGITGRGPWACKYTGTAGAIHCRQSLNYRLP